MTKQRELEMLLLTMFAAVPLYFTQTIGAGPLIAFHLVMTGIVVRVASGKGPELIPALIMRGLAIAYIAFYAVDAAAISRSAIAASTHLVLFIATYQPIESVHRNNYAQRLLTAGLIFIASLATATHITIVLFVIAFAFLMFRQMMYVSHAETVRSIQRDYSAAETAFDDFLRQYPNHPLAGNAIYWMGESLFVRGQYRAAANSFLKGYQTYGKSEKAPESLLKLAMSLQRLGQKDAACSSFNELNTKFPNAPARVKSAAQSERQRGGC